MKIRSLTLTAARVAFYGTCISGFVSCSDVDTAQVTVECDTINSTSNSPNECAVPIPAVRNTNEPRPRDQILNNVVEPPTKQR